MSLNIQSKLIDLLNKEFTEEQQKFYVANLWMYINYNSSHDYPINLENVYKMIGFSNKGNAKRTLENNFTINEDYKIIATKLDEKKQLLHTEKLLKLGGSGILQEDIMLNTDTFKSLCMIAKTDKGKEIRKYYVKLENINHKITNDKLQEQKQLFLDQEKNHDKNKEQFLLKSFNNKYIVYLILISEYVIKYGFTKDIRTRLSDHKSDFGKDIKLIFAIESKNNELLETQLEKHKKINY